MAPPSNQAALHAALVLENSIETDALIVGAGPVGLFQVFELGLLEIKAHVIDTLDQPGGQCIELYPDKPIYDIPALPFCTGRELTERLLQQIAPFAPTFHFGQQVAVVKKQPDGRFFVETSKGTRFLSKTLFIAAGVGAFQPRTLKIEGLVAFEGSQLFYKLEDPNSFAGKNVVIVGGDDLAVDAALALATQSSHQAASVILIHRRDVFSAQADKVAHMRALCQNHEMQFIAGQISDIVTSEGLLGGLKVTTADGLTRLVPMDMLLVFLGLSPRLGPISHWGLDLERKQLKVDTEKFSTSEPGIFAIGDINTYPGKKKLILCGFHECTLAAFAAIALIAPEKRIFLQYTTTSPKLHKLLGVESPVSD